MNPRVLSGVLTVSLLSVFGATAAQASTITIPIASVVNENLRGVLYSGGDNYPIAPTTLTVGGIAFDLVPLANTTDSLGIIKTDGPFDALTFDIPTSIFGATTIYTLMSSTFGVDGANIATIEFQGTGGADVAFDLVEGSNIRDHFNGGYVNTIDPSIPSVYFGPNDEDRLDRQTFVLPSLFATNTLTHIIITATNSSFGDGQAFLAAATAEIRDTDVAAVPEPATLALVGVGLVFAAVRRRRS